MAVHGLSQAFCIRPLVSSQESAGLLAGTGGGGEPEACMVSVREVGSWRWVSGSRIAEDNGYGQGKTEAFPD